MKNKIDKRIYIYIGIALLIIIIAIIMGTSFKKTENKIDVQNEVDKALKNNDKLVVYVMSSNSKKCSKCHDIKTYIDKRNLKYVLYDVEKENKEKYNKLLDTLKIDKEIFNYPALIYIQNNMMFANIINVNNNKTVDLFIKDYDLLNIK